MSAEMHDYAVALQKAIEAHCRGEVIVGDTAKECPHHAKKLNETLAERDQLKAANAELAEALERIVALRGTENDEWDGVDRVIPEMCEIARAALTKHQGAAA
jgi:hypothetical protein